MRKTTLFILSTIMGTVAGMGIAISSMEKSIRKKSDMSDKHLALFLMMNEWVKVKQEGKNLAEYFERNGYKKIAIYGMHYLGEALLRELRDTSIEVNYAIDRNAKNISCDIPCVDLRGTLEAVDVIVVTPITSFFEIEDELSKKVSCPIISIEDVIFDMQ